MSESYNELIISAEDLARIRAACQQRAAELAGASQPASEPTGLSQSANGKLPDVGNLTDAERFAAAVEMMPPNVRRFFQAEDPTVSPRQSESDQDRLECETRASFGGWCGG
jgi:hypothetical protein